MRNQQGSKLIRRAAAIVLAIAFAIIAFEMRER
jgi:hypothetical protein